MNDHSHNPFPAVTEGAIGDTVVQTVNARDLHAFLGVGKDFSTWIKDRIAAYAFNENSDFTTVEAAPQIRGAGNRGARTDYHLTLDMAKELAMVERNEKGKEVRRYFIDCERKAKEAARVRAEIDFSDPVVALGVLTHMKNQVEQAKAKIAVLQPQADALSRIATADGSLCITDAAKTLQMRPSDLFKWLQTHDWIYGRVGNSHHVGYQAKIAAGYLEHKVTSVYRSDGSEKTVTQVRVTPKGLTKLGELLSTKPPQAEAPSRQSTLLGLAAACLMALGFFGTPQPVKALPAPTSITAPISDGLLRRYRDFLALELRDVMLEEHERAWRDFPQQIPGLRRQYERTFDDLMTPAPRPVVQTAYRASLRAATVLSAAGAVVAP